MINGKVESVLSPSEIQSPVTQRPAELKTETASVPKPETSLSEKQAVFTENQKLPSIQDFAGEAHGALQESLTQTEGMQSEASSPDLIKNMLGGLSEMKEPLLDSAGKLLETEAAELAEGVIRDIGPEAINLGLQAIPEVIDVAGDVASYVPIVGDAIGLVTDTIGAVGHLLPEVVDVAAPLISGAVEIGAPIIDEATKVLEAVITDPSQAPDVLLASAGNVVSKVSAEIVETGVQALPELIDLGIESIPEVLELGGDVVGFVPAAGDAVSTVTDVIGVAWSLGPDVIDVAAPLVSTGVEMAAPVISEASKLVETAADLPSNEMG
jgi:hypothetical protein